MKRPPINPKEHVALYDYYKNRMPNEKLAKFGHALLAKVIKPTVTWEPEALDAVSDHLEEGKPLLMFAKHSRKTDVLLPAVLVKQEPVLRPLIGHARILAHAGMFKNVVTRLLFDGLGAIPVFRSSKIKDFGGEQVSGVTESLIDATSACMNSNQTVAGFPEGGFRPDHPDIVGDLGKGMVQLATEGEHVDKTLSLAVGIAYESAGKLRLPKIAMHIAAIRPLAGEGLEVASEAIREQMKHATLTAQNSLASQESLQR